MGRFFSHLTASWCSTGFLVLFSFIFALLICYWYNPKRREECELLAKIPFKDDEN